MYHQYSQEALERKAEEILIEYKDGYYIKNLEPIDVDEFAEFYIGASIDFANLSDDYKTLGLTCFYDGLIEIWNDSRTEKRLIKSFGDTIFLETETELISSPQRTRFTIMHECCHIKLHKRFYYVGKNQRNKKINYKPYRCSEWTKNPPMTDIDIHEWQANRLAAALLVPRKTLFKFLQAELMVETNKLYLLDISDQLIERISDLYFVSKETVKRRLRDLEIIKDYFGG